MISQHSANKNVRLKTPMLRSDFCDYSDVYIVVKCKMPVTDTYNGNRRNKKLIFENNAPFSSCILENNNTFIRLIIPIYW